MRHESQRSELIECLQELERSGVLEAGGGAAATRVPGGEVLVTPTGMAFRRWQISPADLVVTDLDGTVVERRDHLGAAPTPLFLSIMREFPEVNAVIHAHSEWSLVFAAAGIEVPPVTNAFDKLSPVPCVICDDGQIKTRYRNQPWPVFFPDAMLRRPDVAAVEAYVAERASDIFRPRREEFHEHSLAFTMLRHGIVVAGPDLRRAAADLTIIEVNARTAYRLGLSRNSLMGGADEELGAGLREAAAH
jgi:ribulose-5-phosphate 4-epimerase/fuculose-1-phosphate aldolase